MSIRKEKVKCSRRYLAGPCLRRALNLNLFAGRQLPGHPPYLKVIGALVIALLLGMVMQVGRPVLDYSRPGIGLIANKFLRLGIILLGFKLNLIALAQAGIKTIALAVVVVTFTILVTYQLARRFGVDRHLAILTASGTGICGAAAVMGISSQLTSDDDPATKLRHQENEVAAVAIVAILGTLFTLIEIGPATLAHDRPAIWGDDRGQPARNRPRRRRWERRGPGQP